jgi:hypothetical protein
MDIGFHRVRNLEFPGEAGELQRVGATASLVRELGDNYAQYHDFLAAELEKLGGRPKASGEGPSPEFLAHWQRADDIIASEVVLRVCRGYRKAGRSLAAAPDLDPALVDTRDRLLSVETRQPLDGTQGSTATPRVTPPMPKWFPERR